MRKLFNIMLCFQLLALSCRAQEASVNPGFNHQDTLRGSDGPERTWWDVTHYDLTVKPDYLQKTIAGRNIISFKAISAGQQMQIDMQAPMEITAVTYNQQPVKSTREGNVFHIDLGKIMPAGTSGKLDIQYSGRPREAVKPPWDGGWIWKKDASGAPWMSAACQGLGASVWYPCKDYQGDEPDSAKLNITVPDTLVAIGNGRLRNTIRNNDGTSTYFWAVTNPISTYCIIPSIGKYAHWSEVYAGEKGRLDCDYWVLKENEQKARSQFKQVPEMLKCFEHWFGPYPFYEDGYKLVESPHLGMEHQSAVAYGNKFGNGYLGRDLSGTGWGLKWDFIIVHESGHEWFGNNITTKDIADMWVHEGFTNYSETLFTECQSGKKAGDEYCIGSRRGIVNDTPIIAPYGVNREGSTDMYYKGASLLHTIREIIGDDEKFRAILIGLNKTFYHQTVTSAQIEGFISHESGIDLSKIFDQYLRTTRVPVFEYKYTKGQLNFRWSGCIDGFDMPLRITTDKELTLHPTTQWQTMSIPSASFKIDPNFFVSSRKM